MSEESPTKKPRLEVENCSETCARKISIIGFLGISDYGLGQLEVLASKYKVAFATAKKSSVKHAQGMEKKMQRICAIHGIEYLGAVDANSNDIVERARQTDLIHIGGYDAILKGPILDAPRYGVLNTHLGVLPLNRGCFPTMWAQLHDLVQGYTTYQVGSAIDHGDILDIFMADPGLGGLAANNRVVYNFLAQKAVERFGEALVRFERGDTLKPCAGREAYHRKGLPNDGWMSFHWSNNFLKRFSLCLDFTPYLPGKTALEGFEDDPIFLSVESVEDYVANAETQREPCIGEILESEPGFITVRTREGQLRCSVCKGTRPDVGSVLMSQGGVGNHPIDIHFSENALPLDRYLCNAT